MIANMEQLVGVDMHNIDIEPIVLSQALRFSPFAPVVAAGASEMANIYQREPDAVILQRVDISPRRLRRGQALSEDNPDN